MSTFLHDLQGIVEGQARSLLKTEIQKKPIPFLEVHVRNLEQAQIQVTKQAADAEGLITTLTRQRCDVIHAMEHDKLVAQAFMAKNPPDEASARGVAY